MMSRSLRRFAPLGLLLPAIAALAGGWAVVTVEDLPDHVVAGRPVQLEFTVRQHGVEPMTGLEPQVEVRGRGAPLRAMAAPAGAAGRYRATLTVPEPGDWTLTVHSGFGKSRLTLVPIAAVAPGAAPAVLSDRERGQRLFVAKGCVTCHLHRAVAGSGTFAVGPELTERPLAPDYLARYLADPSISPTNRARGDGAMPDLDLDQAEIGALVAFLGGERRASR
jgi:mono/diheme cytochrome c family protein